VHGNALDDGGVVDQDVDASKVVLDGRNHGGDLVLIGYIAYVAFYIEAALFILGDRGVAPFFRSAAEGDACAGFAQGPCHGKADAMGSSGDKGDFAFEIILNHRENLSLSVPHSYP